MNPNETIHFLYTASSATAVTQQLYYWNADSLVPHYVPYTGELYRDYTSSQFLAIEIGTGRGPVLTWSRKNGNFTYSNDKLNVTALVKTTN